jgi:hypothetical protein
VILKKRKEKNNLKELQYVQRRNKWTNYLNYNHRKKKENKFKKLLLLKQKIKASAF